MAQPSSRPNLNPQFCFSTTILRDFLRLSRGSIDDAITQNLNALVTPAREGFDPSSSARLHRPGGSRMVDPRACEAFKNEALFPSWQTRSDVLNYCASVATSPDPDDPDSLLREIESESDRERVVDERLDPYSARFFPREARTEVLATIVRNERTVENIIRKRTWEVIAERCGPQPERWDEALNRWREKRREDLNRLQA